MLVRVCQQCGRLLTSDVVFCTACGTPCLDHHHIRQQPTAEDRRRISVLFIDLVGFTPYVENSDPERVRELQTGFFAPARHVINRYGGVVEKYIGDAVMALFGAPIATETDAIRCVRAGLELQRVLTRLTLTGEVRPRFRVGIATGEALVNVAAARDGGQAIVAGDVVNTASRLQGAAPHDGVLVCGSTYAATHSAIRYIKHPPISLRGKSNPTEVWLALSPAVTVHKDSETATPLINRTHELGLLINALDRVLRERRPQLVTLLGHAGIGKSRLVQELYKHTENMGEKSIKWCIGNFPPFGENAVYTALADIVKEYAEILDTDSADIARRRLELTISDLVDPTEVHRLVDALSPLVGLPSSTIVADEAESLWRRFIVALASHRPMVLVFENLHWADTSMLHFIELLSAAVSEVPLLILCTSRPELINQEPSWSARIGGALTIALPPLRDTEIASIYIHLLGQVTFSSEALNPLVELAHGNPLYAHEYTRMLVEQGALGLVERLCHGQHLPMPDNVHAVIANRIDLLDPSDRTILQAASVVGMDFWPGAVAAAMGMPIGIVERSLRRLEQRGLVHECSRSSMAGQPEYGFSHLLVKDVCYQRLPRTELIAHHERTADWLDAIETDRNTDLTEAIAHHRYTAYEIAQALDLDVSKYVQPARRAIDKAARRAYSLYALDTAASLVDRALALRCSEPDNIDQLRLELLATEIAFYSDGDVFLAHGGGDRLTRLAERLDADHDKSYAARAWTLRGQASWLHADHTHARTCVEKAVALYGPMADSKEKAEAYAELGRLHMLNYEHDPAVAAASTAAEIAERLGLAEVEANAQITVGTAHYQAGDPQGLLELHTIVATCRNKRLLALGRGVQNLAFALIEEGDLSASEMLRTSTAPYVPGGHNLTTGYSIDVQRSWFNGDWCSLMIASQAILASPRGEWDLQARGLQSWIGLLRGEKSADDNSVQGLLEAGERSGFHRLRWSALAHGALCRALDTNDSDATDLLLELASQWRGVRAIATGEWVPAAAYAAALVGGPVVTTIRDLLSEVPRHTPWVNAATHTIAGALSTGDKAIHHHHTAAMIYDSIPNYTEKAIASALSLRVDPSRGKNGYINNLCEFASRNKAPGLLALAHLM